MQLTDHLYRKLLFIRFTMRVFGFRLSIFMSVSFPSGFEGGMCDLIVLLPDQCFSFSLISKYCLSFLNSY